jgi:hypothetical protein
MEEGMGCFCHAALGPLMLQLPKLDIALSLDLPGANIPLGLSAWLSARGLPASPWLPDPAWLNLQLPIPRLNLSAIATISALASLRAQVLAQFGIDLLIPGQVNAFARIVATMNARLSAMAMINPLGWIQLANLNSAIDQITLALRAGLLLPSESLMLSLTMPGGYPMNLWAALLNLLRSLAPLIAAALHLNVGITAIADFSAAIRILARLQLPALAAPGLMASLSAALSAVASLQLSLGVPVLQLGFPAIRLQIQAKLGALMSALSAHFGLSLQVPNLLAMLLAMLPKLPMIPTALATAEVVQLAMQAHALAALNWQVPLSLPAIQIGLPTCSLVAQLQLALNLNAVLPSPCGSGCDAAALLNAFAAA